MDVKNVQFARRFDGISGSAIREIFKMIAQPDMISFAGGNPSPAALPDQLVGEIAARVVAQHGKTILQYGATEGYPPFLESLKAYVTQVTGSTQGMDLLCKALIDPGDAVLVEDPSFLGNLQCIRLYQGRLIPVDSDENGLLPEALEKAMAQHHPKLLYVIPTFQNPTGKTLTLERRRIVAQLAEKYGVVVAEDDPYRDLRYSGTALPTIKSFDQAGWVVFMGSFSKVISPGLRVGYIAGDAGILRKCTLGKQSSDLHTPNLNQAIVDCFLRENLLPGHIAAICRGYAAQRDAMLKQLDSFPAGTSFTRPDGGLFIWVNLPEGVDAKTLLQTAVSRRVAYVPGTHFYANGGHEHSLRLNFSNSTEEQIVQGMGVLRRVISEALGQ